MTNNQFLTLQDIPGLRSTERVQIMDNAKIPLINAMGPVIHPIVLPKETIRGLILTNFKVRLFEAGIIKTVEKTPKVEIPAEVKTAEEVIVEETPKVEIPAEVKTAEEVIVEETLTEKEEILESIETVGAYTFNDLKDKNVDALRKILKSKNVKIKSNDKDELIEQIIGLN